MNYDPQLPENRLCGIYAIWCSVPSESSGKNEFYIGSTGMKTGFSGRWRAHHSFLTRKKDDGKQIILRNAYQKYGPDNFYAFVLEVIPYACTCNKGRKSSPKHQERGHGF